MILYNNLLHMINFDWSDLLYFGAALFFTHGMFDIIAIQPNWTNNAALYVSFMLFYNILYLYSPTFCIIIFIYTSMYHFGEDFRFVFTTLQKKYPTIHSFDNLDNRWAGMSLFSSSVFFGYDTWLNGLTNLQVEHPNYIIYTLLFMTIPSLIGSHKNLLAFVISSAFGITGPYPGLIIYAFAIHAPLAMHRYVMNKSKEYTRNIIGLWIVMSCITYLLLPYLFKFLQGKNIYSLLISLVMAHVVAITHWQLLQKTVTSTGKLIVEH